MNKNWLIRTKSNHILGPVSKAKVTELYKNGSVKADDEFCSGNGYWFFVKEKALVEKYLLGDEPQEFNPISEANDVLQDNSSQSNSTAVINLNDLKAKEKAQEEDTKLPSNDDLDYPDMGSPTPPKAAPVAQAQSAAPAVKKEEIKLPPAPPEMKTPAPVRDLKAPEKKSEQVDVAPPKRREVAAKKKLPEAPPKPQGKQSQKMYMAIIVLLMVVIVAIVYQKFVLKKKTVVWLPSVIESADAQTPTPVPVKKKF